MEVIYVGSDKLQYAGWRRKMTLGRLLRSINLLNILLAAAAVAAAHYIVLPRIDEEAHFHLAPVKTAQIEAPVESKKKKTGSEPPVQPAAFILIADQNIFHPDRKISVNKPQEKILPKPELVLYGTLITDNTLLAYVDDINATLTTPGRGKRLRVLRIGDMAGDFKLKEIHTDMIVLERGSEVLTVDLSESKRKRQNPAVPSVQAAVPKPETNPRVRGRQDRIDPQPETNPYMGRLQDKADPRYQ